MSMSETAGLKDQGGKEEGRREREFVKKND